MAQRHHSPVEATRQARDGQVPFVSVIMPVRNEGAWIARSVGAVLHQDYPSERMEIIVADGLSTDGTRDALLRLSGSDTRVKVIDNPRGIVPCGLNAALGMAKGEIIVRVDGHCEIAPNYISCCVRHLRAGTAEGVGGPLETVGETAFAKTIALAMSSRFGVGDSAFRTRKDVTTFTDTVAFPAYPRRVMDAAGAFDEVLVRNQDDEYNYRLRKQGARILLAADVRARYYSRATLRSLCVQYFQYGYWKVRVLRKHPRQMGWRQFVPPVFVLALVGTALLALAAPGAFPLFAFVGLSYLAANLVVSGKIAARSGWGHLGGLPVVFAALHLSYGAGFSAGIARLVMPREARSEGRTGRRADFLLPGRRQ